MEVLCFRLLIKSKNFRKLIVPVHFPFNNTSSLNYTNFERDLIKWCSNLLWISASISLAPSCLRTTIACITLIPGIFISFPIGMIRQLRMMVSKLILIPKYKAHSEKNSLPYPKVLKHKHNWSQRNPLWHIHTLFCVIFTGMFFAESWLNFHIPLHALYLAVGKEKERQAEVKEILYEA